MKRKLAILVVVGVIVFAGVQFVPVKRTNPVVTGDIGAPPGIAEILRASCYDCHSHETRWPFYAWIAPASWVVTGDVVEGRVALNFSVWNSFDRKERLAHLSEAVEEVEEGEMPPWMYVMANPGARLNGERKERLLTWLKGEVAGLKQGSAEER